MAYDAEKTWADLVTTLGSAARNSIQHLEVGLRAWAEWNNFKDGRTNAQIATALGKTEADIQAMSASFVALKRIHDFANGDTVANLDYLSNLRDFS